MRTVPLIQSLLISIVALIFFSSPAWSTKLPSELINTVQKQFSKAQIRIDGSIETTTNELYLPLIPCASNTQKTNVRLEACYPSENNAKLLAYSNGWYYLKVERKGTVQSIEIPLNLPDKLKKKVLTCRFPSDLVVPTNFVLPTSLKSIAGDISVTLIDDATINQSSLSKQIKQAQNNILKRGAIFITSPSAGTITLLDETSLKKIFEFPTEGTPSGMSFADGRLYIADQAKFRILILDPNKRQFIGQIDLPKSSAPKGLAILPNGHLLYVSESASNSIAVIEVATGKVLLRTKVSAGPGKIAITPNGNNLLALNVPASQVTIISTFNQKVLGSVSVGAMPNAIVISQDSRLAFVSNRVSNTVSIIDINKRQIIGSLRTGNGPTGIVLNAANSKLFVANAKDNTISVFDLQTKEKIQDVKLPINVDFPGSLLLLPDGKRLLVSSESTDTIGVFDTNKLEFDTQPIIGHTSDEMLWVPVE